MKAVSSVIVTAALATLFAGCGQPSDDDHAGPGADVPQQGTGRARDDQSGSTADDQSHAHDEVSLGTVAIDGMEVQLAQGHGAVQAGKEGHLVVKLPYSDDGSTIVRAWIGTEDRTLSFVGKGAYARSHDDYDVHATAPDPLPAAARWWIEIEKPDGTKVLGSAEPLLN